MRLIVRGDIDGLFGLALDNLILLLVLSGLCRFVLGFDDVQGYQKNGNVYFGATIGRFGNRLSLVELGRNLFEHIGTRIAIWIDPFTGAVRSTR